MSDREREDVGVRTREARIERACDRHLAALPAIERAAARLFAPEDLAPALRDETTEPATFARAAAEERLWVALDANGEPVGFALVEAVDGLPHLREMDVHPDHARRGIGRRLVDAVLAAAREAGHPAVTLTTFRRLPWNAPFYARCGFRELRDAEIGPELGRVLAEEADAGLDPRKRVAMRCDLIGPR